MPNFTAIHHQLPNEPNYSDKNEEPLEETLFREGGLFECSSCQDHRYSTGSRAFAIHVHDEFRRASTMHMHNELNRM